MRYNDTRFKSVNNATKTETNDNSERENQEHA